MSDEGLHEGQEVIEQGDLKLLESAIRESGRSTIGEFLSYIREKRGISYEDIDRMTRIGPRWIMAIENSEWSIYPSLIYAKGHIRGYAEMLGIDGNVLIQHFQSEIEKAFPDESFHVHVHPIQNFNQIFQPSASKRERHGKKSLAVFIGILILLFIFGLSRILHRHIDRNTSLIPPPVTNPGILTPENHPGAKLFAPAAVSPSSQSDQSGSSGLGEPANSVTGSPSSTPRESETSAKNFDDQVNVPQEPGVVQKPSGSSPAHQGKVKIAVNAVTKKTTVPVDFRLKVVAVRDTWVGIQVDGTKEIKIPLDRGQWHIFHGKKSFRITTDDGGSLLLYLNTQKIGKAGEDDQPVYGRLITLNPE